MTHMLSELIYYAYTVINQKGITTKNFFNQSLLGDPIANSSVAMLWFILFATKYDPSTVLRAVFSSFFKVVTLSYRTCRSIFSSRIKWLIYTPGCWSFSNFTGFFCIFIYIVRNVVHSFQRQPLWRHLLERVCAQQCICIGV